MKRQKKRSKWLASVTPWRRYGTETEEHGALVTRIGSRPPTYRLENYADGTKTVAMMTKAEKGTRGYDLTIVGPDEKAVILRFTTRKRAILAFMNMEPVREEEAA
jgi:hypothetical protein